MHFLVLLLLATGVTVFAAEAPAPGPEAKRLVAAYRAGKTDGEKTKALTALREARCAGLGGALVEEYDRLDLDKPEDAALGGAILQWWAAQEPQHHLPVLIFEGLFHDEAAVVRACADAAGRLEAATRSLLSTGRAPTGRQPQQEFAVDLIGRMMERRDLVEPLEKILVAWSNRKRPDAKEGAALDEAGRTAVIEFWKKWYEERFHAKFKPPEEEKPTAPKP